MQRIKLSIACFLFVCTLFTSIAPADTLIFNNSNYTGYVYPMSTYTEMLDFGTSPGGRISKFTFGYTSTSSGTVWVRFYQYTSSSYEGTQIKQFTLTGVPSTDGFVDTYEYVIPEEQRFDLPGGNFGYSLEFSGYSPEIALATGGTGIDRYFWEEWYGDLYPYSFSTSYNSYFQVYSAPPIDEVTCDIYGYKFDDQNANGIWESSEPNIGGWEFYLDLNNDGVYQVSEPNVVADPNGMYLFENLDAPATYTIREIMPDGWSQTLPGSSGGYQYVLAAEPNTIYTDYNFGNTTQTFSATITGKVFSDANGNSVYDPGESGQSSWRIYLDTNENGQWDVGEPLALTNSLGNYSLIAMIAGTYTLREEMKSGWVQTFPTDACSYPVTLDTSGQVITDMDFGNHTFNDYGGGSGTLADPYLISDDLHLQALGAHPWDWDMHFKQTANFTLAKYQNEEFNLIGRYNYYDQMTPFSGTYDGNGFYIGLFNYTYTGIRQEHIGLFGYVHGASAEIKNLKLYDTHVDTQGSGVSSGALVGWLRSGTVSNCFVGRGLIQSPSFGAGGLIGESNDGLITDCHARIDAECPDGPAGGLVGCCSSGTTVQDCSAEGTVTGLMGTGGLVGENSGQILRCYADADVTGFQYTGGLVGENYGDIAECYALGTVQTIDDDTFGHLTGNEAGGLVGRNIGDGTILDCSAAASVTGGNQVGGLVGVTWSSSGTCTITNCYAVGPVTGGSSVGGLIGTDYDSVITNCVWDTQTTGKTSSNGGTGKTTWQMKNEGTYRAMDWDLSTPVWNLCPAIGYPVLNWQNCQAGPGGVTMKWSVREGDIYPEYPKKIRVDPAGNVVTAGYGYVKHANNEVNHDMMLCKYTASGTHLWTQTYDSDPQGDVTDTAWDMAIDSMGNIYVAGESDGDVLVLKYNSSGTRLWHQTYDGPANERETTEAIAIDTSGNVYIAAVTNNITTTREDFCLIKYNTNGVFQWVRIQDGGYGDYDSVTGLVVDSQGNVTIMGEPGTPSGISQIMTLQYNSTGTLRWSQVYESPSGVYLWPYKIRVDASDNIYIAGVYSDSGNDDIFILKYDTFSTPIWTSPVLFDLAGDDQNVSDMVLDNQANICLVGVNDTAAGEDFLTVKFTADGQYLWHQLYNGDDNKEDMGLHIAVDDRQNVYVAGYSDYWREGYQIKGGKCTTQKYSPQGQLLWSIGYRGHLGLLQAPEGLAVANGDVFVTGSFENDWVYPDLGIICYSSCSWTGDADVDHKVNLADIATLGANWLQTDCGECQHADWTGDSDVQLDDLIAVTENWLNGN